MTGYEDASSAMPMRLEIRYSRATRPIFKLLQQERQTRRQLEQPFNASGHFVGLVLDGVKYRELAAKGQISAKLRIPLLDRYYDDKFLGRDAGEAIKIGLITIDELAQSFASTETLRNEIVGNRQLYYRVIPAPTKLGL